MIKTRAFQNATRRKIQTSSRQAPVMTAADARRSQLIENTPSKQLENFQNWLLHIGASPKAGLPASQIGMYTDFN